MGLFDRVNRVIRNNLDDAALSQNPEKTIENALEEMQRALMQMRHAVASAIVRPMPNRSKWIRAAIVEKLKREGTL